MSPVRRPLEGTQRVATAARGRISLLAAGALLALAGCATPPSPRLPIETTAAPNEPAPVHYSGRLSVQVADAPERSFSADFELDGSARRGELLLSGPLGAGAARARWSPEAAVLVTAQGERRAADLTELSRQAFGEAVPIAALFDWLAGRPWPGAATQDLVGGGDTTFVQLGWLVDLSRHPDGLVKAERLPTPDGGPMVTVRVKFSPA